MAKQVANQYPIPTEIEALLTLVKSAATRKAASRVPPDLWTMSLEGIEARLKPSEAAKAIRAAFWNEIGGAILLGQGVKVSRLAERAALSYDHCHDVLTRDPIMLVWVLRSPRGQVDVAPLLSELMSKVRLILELPFQDELGRVSVRNANAILRTVQVLWSIRERPIS